MLPYIYIFNNLFIHIPKGKDYNMYQPGAVVATMIIISKQMSDRPTPIIIFLLYLSIYHSILNTFNNQFQVLPPLIN